MKSGYTLSLLLLFCLSSNSLDPRYRSLLDPSRHSQRAKTSSGSSSSDSGLAAPAASTFSQLIDHFTHQGGDGGDRFNQRYIVLDQFVDPAATPENPSPIFFYCGNEGKIENFYDNTGQLTAAGGWAEKMKAKVVFAEHRFYGDSQPFPTEDWLHDPEKLKFLTLEQAMMDYVEIIKDLKKAGSGLENSPVIAFGGSYGGMLAAWMRMKYPHWIQGAVAASAPIYFFPGYINPYAYAQVATQSYKSYNAKCPDIIHKGFTFLNETKGDATKKAALKKDLNVCQDVKEDSDVSKIIGLFDNSLGSMAMVNYPYETNFLKPLPEWPVKVSCEAAVAAEPQDATDATGYMKALRAAAKIYYETTVDECIDLTKIGGDDSNLDDAGWGAQVCTQMVMPQANSGVTDMFLRDPWNPTQFEADCQTTYGTKPQWDWALDFFGGRTPVKDFYRCSKIIFSNGELDPWKTGGQLEGLTDDCPAFVIPKAAHHLDLRAENAKDPQEVKDVRTAEEILIRAWIQKYNEVTMESSNGQEKFIQ